MEQEVHAWIRVGRFQTQVQLAPRFDDCRDGIPPGKLSHHLPTLEKGLNCIHL